MIISSTHLDNVLKEEAEFADKQYLPYAKKLEISPRMFRVYKNPRFLWDWVEMSAKLLGDIRGKKLLDFGCGMGEESIIFAKLGADVFAFDISEVGIRITKKRAVHNCLENRVTAKVMSVGEIIQLEDESFDVVHGLGILHHVDPIDALNQINRVLRTGGIGVFLEPMGNNRIVEAIKQWLIKRSSHFTQGTDHETVLNIKDLREYCRIFSSSEFYTYHLLYRVKKFFPKLLWTSLKRIDHKLIEYYPKLEHFAGAVVIKVTK